MATALFCPVTLLTACGPAVDPPPLEIHECPADDSPAEFARYDGAPLGTRLEPIDLGHAITVRLEPTNGEVEHDLVDNCGGAPLRLKETFEYRPGAARVGGDVVLCGAGLGGREGIWELLEDGSAGQDLGLGLGCLERVNASDSRTGVSAYGFVWNDAGWAQHLPDGTVRSIPFPGSLTRVGDTWLVHSEGKVAMLAPDGADAVVLDLPDRITDILTPPDSSPWVILLPDFEGQNAKRLYALDTTDGSWFNTAPVSPELDPTQVSIRDGLAVTRSSVYGPVEFMRAQWDAPLPTDLDKDASITVVDEEHVLVVDRDARLLQIPLDVPGENEAAYEVRWEYELRSGHPLAASDPGMLWNGLVLLPYLDEVWAFPVDGSTQYPFLPHGLSLESTYFGNEFITAMVYGLNLSNDARLVRKARGRELEVIADDVVNFRQRAWTPELGRILYAVRDYGGVSIRQHRLTD